MVAVIMVVAVALLLVVLLYLFPVYVNMRQEEAAELIMAEHQHQEAGRLEVLQLLQKGQMDMLILLHIFEMRKYTILINILFR